MKYICALITVSDINVSRKFYEDLFGLEVIQDFGKNIGFSCGLSLIQEFERILFIPKEKVIKGTNDMELVFEEEDFDGFVKTLKKRSDIKYLHDIIEQPWGQRTVRFYDPDRNLIEVGENMKTVTKRFLDSGLSKEQAAEKMGVSVEALEWMLNFG
jgi:catechol 2,3-dioxygenase-like lactoylglutathione lyase family enzyme